MKHARAVPESNWRSPSYDRRQCPQCIGEGCSVCNDLGKLRPVLSRSEAIRRSQARQGEKECFGRTKERHWRCERDECPYTRQCRGLRQPNRFRPERLREESLEYLSRMFLMARAIELPSSRLSSLQTDIDECISQWLNDTPQVALLGAFSSGKSTLLNRFLKQDLLPTFKTPTTSAITVLKYGEKPLAELEFRQEVRLPLMSQDGPDIGAVGVLTEWLKNPKKHKVKHIREVCEEKGREDIDCDRHLLLKEMQQLKKPPRSAAEPRGPRERKAIGRAGSFSLSNRTFLVAFEKAPPRRLHLENPRSYKSFQNYLTQPELALRVRKAVCSFPVKELEQVNFLDTAGLCSPLKLHTDVTRELLSRRPDKILILLDSRRLSCPLSSEALRQLEKFVAKTDDFHQVTFAVTFWDSLLSTYMKDDRAQALDYNSEEHREIATRELEKEKREELEKCLKDIVSVSLVGRPVIFPLAMGNLHPWQHKYHTDSLLKHLSRECREWVGVKMWSTRCRNAWSFVEDLTSTLNEVRERCKMDLEDIQKPDREDRLERVQSAKKRVIKATDRARRSLKNAVVDQKEFLLARIQKLDSRKAIKQFLDDGYWNSANEALNSIQEISKDHRQNLAKLWPRAHRRLKAVSLDRKLLGLDREAKVMAQGKVDGWGYHVGSVWDFFLAIFHEFTAELREAARAVLRNEVESFVEIVSVAVDQWCSSLDILKDDIIQDYEEQEDGLMAHGAAAEGRIAALQRKLDFLSKIEPQIHKLAEEFRRHNRSLENAEKRVYESAKPGFAVKIHDEHGCQTMVRYKKGHGEMILFRPRESAWKEIEISLDGCASRYVPRCSLKKPDRIWLEDTKESRRESNVVVPPEAESFRLSLGSLEGRFILPKALHGRAVSERSSRP